jgi:pyridoxal/pyridoxine/pyridoxamine kinase
MTNEEAIERLQMILDGDMTLYMMNEKDAEAVHYAIKALKKGDRKIISMADNIINDEERGLI